LDSKDVSQAWSAVVPEGAEYDILALLVEYEYTGQHLESVVMSM
jgi:hypothetical protein